MAHSAVAAGDAPCASIEIAYGVADAPEAGRAEAARLFGRSSTDVKRAGDLGLPDRNGDIRWTSW